VSSSVDHSEFSEALGAYALGALSQDESARVREHLAGCRECRAELEWLRAAVDALPASVPQIEPPPELRTRVMGVVEAESELLRAAGEAADRPQRAGRPRRRWPGLSGLRPSVVVVTACVVAVLAGGFYLSFTGAGGVNGPRTIRAQVHGPARTAHARATLQLRGSHAELVVTRLPLPPADHVDELWVQRGSAAPVPAGTFIVSTGSVAVTRRVRPGDHVLVTVERGRGTSAPTTTPFIVAKA
jgi:anti-sigma-K factor RskA